jgi:UDP-GlcNAc:undecaprenyl-phosphate GlcNAc-1-phosphate transferase
MPNFHPSPILAFVVAFGLLHWFNSRPNVRLPLDKPNNRSLHSTPVPRVGGIAILTGFAISLFTIDLPVSTILAVCVFLLATVSFVDDWIGVSAVWRLAAHLCAAGFVSSNLLFIDYGGFAMILAALSIAWMTNLYNFMDGSDGLAGGMTMFGFSFYAVAALAAGDTAFGWANASIAAASAAFLIFNFNPARIFMGDAGSVPLGFLAATFGIVGWLHHNWTWWYPLLVFSPFIVDASVTLARRLGSGIRVWEAHRDHYYQRLVQMGFGHKGTAFAEYILMLACGTVALWAMTLAAHAQQALLSLMGLLYVVLIAIIERLWRARHKSNA